MRVHGDGPDGFRTVEPEEILGRANGSTKSKPRPRFDYWRVDDMKNQPPPDYVVDGMIPKGGQSVLFSPSGSYKTTTAIDLSVSIAFGRPFHGIPVKACPVIYVANEDAYGVGRQRILGMLDYYGLRDERIIVVPGGVLLSDSKVVDGLIATAEDAFPGEVCGFVFDTWDKTLGGDPDKAVEVVPAVAKLDALVEAGAPFVLTLSHTPWTNQDRAKGAVPYWAAQSSRMKSSRDPKSGIGTIEVVHMKNGPSGLTLHFDYERHAFTVNGHETECLIPIRRMDGPAQGIEAPDRVPPKLPKNQSLALSALLAAIVDFPVPTPSARDIPRTAKGTTVVRWREAFDRYTPELESKHKASRFREASQRLAVDRRVMCVDGFVWVPPRPETRIPEPPKGGDSDSGFGCHG